MNSAVFSPDGARVLTASDDNTARLWDVSRTSFFPAEPGICLAAALACGIGLRTASEARDLLMQDPTPKDLFAAAMKQLGSERGEEVQRVNATLRAPLHPNCYLSPTQLAEKFGAPRPVSGEPESEPVREHDEEDGPPDPVPVEGIVGEPPLESGDESRAVQEEAAAPPVTVVRKGVPEVWVGIWLVGVAVLSVAGTLVAMGLGWIDGPAVVAWVRERLRGA